MTTPRSRGATLGLLLLAAFACGGNAPVAPEPAATITLMYTGCAADGLGALLPEHFTVRLVNKTSTEAIFNVQRMNVGHAFGELEVHIAEQQRRFIADIEQMNPPSFTSIVSTSSVDPQQSESLELTLLSGTYGLVCRGVQRPTIWSAYVLGPYRVP
jgi:hypothetical protein